MHCLRFESVLCICQNRLVDGRLEVTAARHLLYMVNEDLWMDIGRAHQFSGDEGKVHGRPLSVPVRAVCG